MANEIKLKRGSGSDPTASDLVVGEVAIRTDTGKLFTKKDDNSVAEISGGISDGDKGDITISSSGSVFTIDSGVVTSAKIANDTIVNADINSSAAIAGSKISPDFGSQNTTTTGTTTTSRVTINSTSPIIEFEESDGNPDYRIVSESGELLFQDADAGPATRLKINTDGHIDVAGNLDVGAGLDVTGDMTITNNIPKISLIDTDNDDDFEIKNQNGVFTVRDATNSADRLTIASDGTTDITNNLNVGAGIDVTGNITVSGTVDGRDVATDGSKLDGIASGATNVTNTNQLTNGAGFITATLTNEQVQDIVGAMVSGNTESGITVTYQDGDGTLDFSVASQTDNNFTTTLKNKLDGIASGATNVTNTNQLTNGAGFITATLTNEQVQDIVGGMVSGNTESGITVTYQDSDGTLDFSVASQTDNNFTTTLKNKLDGIASGATNVSNNNQLTNGAGYITDLVNDTSPQLGGNLDTNSHEILLDDDHAVKFGASSDLQIYHNNSLGNSWITNSTGVLNIRSDGFAIRAQGDSASYINITDNAEVKLYYNNSAKFETTNTGVSVTGTCAATSFSGDGSSLTGISAGATGGGSDEVFYENDQTVTTNYTITNGKNAMSAGPITINSGVTVTVGSGETLTIV